MGCKFGFRGLPEGLLAFPHREWMDTQVYTLRQIQPLFGKRARVSRIFHLYMLPSIVIDRLSSLLQVNNFLTTIGLKDQ